MLVVNYGELYYDHYVGFLGEPIDREVFQGDKYSPRIQILKHKDVFENCLVYNTLGLSKYDHIINDVVEISLVVDGGFDNVGYILASSLFYCINNGIGVGRGVAVGGIENIDKSFVDTYNKSAVYFTEPYAFPEDYRDILTKSGRNKNGKIMLAIFISQSEYEYFKQNGAERFEDLLEVSNVDPFEINRKSII